MSRVVKAAAGVRGFALPSGKILSADKTSVVSDADWALLSALPGVVGTTLLDQGASTADPDSSDLGGGVATDAEVARILAAERAYQQGSFASRSTQVDAFRADLAARRDCDILVFGDSTADALDEWFYLTATALGQAFPAYTVKHHLWSDTLQSYAAPTTIQTGTGGARVDGYAQYTGTAGNYLSTPDSAATSITGDLDVRVRVDPTAYASGATRTLAAKYNFGGQRSWRFFMDGSGYLKVEWSADGTALIGPGGVGPLTGTPGTPQWVRFTLDVDNGASGHDLKFYKSPDGVTWTQVGATFTGVGITSIFDINYALELGSRGLGGSEVFTGNIYRLQVFASVTGDDRRVDLDLNTYQGSASLTSYTGETWAVNGSLAMVAKTGAPVLTAWNGSASGRNAAYHADALRFPKVALPGRPVRLAFISHSHNENANTQYAGAWQSLADQVIARYPAAGIVATLQNPRKAPAAYITEHTDRLSQVRALAGRRRWDVVDAYSALAGDVANNVVADGIHPSPAGSLLWVGAVKKLLGI